MESEDRSNGRIAVSPDPSNAAPAWDPQTLLAPRKFAVPSPSRVSSPRRDMPQPASNGTVPPSSVTFEFANADSNGAAPPDLTDPRLPSISVANGNAILDGQIQVQGLEQGQGGGQGMGSMIERMNGIQERAAQPQNKRRKVDTPDLDANATASATAAIGARGGGDLGAYLQERREEAQLTNPASASQTVDLTEGDDDVEVVRDPGNEEVCYGMLSNRKLQCHTVPSPKPGSKSLFGESWFPPVKVVLKRISGDNNLRIQAYDFTREIIGLVDEDTAKALVPLLDANIRLRTDCRIPARKRLADEVAGKPTSRAYALEIILYGPNKYAKPVGSHFHSKLMALRHPNRVDKGIRYVNGQQTGAMDRPAPGMQPVVAQRVNTYAPGSVVTPRTVEEIRSDVMGVFDAMGKSDDLPEQEPPSTITTELLKHQKQGLFFMTSKERTATPEERTQGSFYRARVTHSAQRFYHNVITGHNERTLPPQSRGGILADMMGLGKTLTVLALICDSLNEARQWANAVPVQPEAPPMRHSSSAAAASTLGLSKLARNARATLLICPLSTVTNWEEQIKQHVAPQTLSYYIYHGSNRVKDVQKLAEYDLVITTYGSVSSELGARSKRKSGKYPLEEIGWFRIVLDEAHMIREVATLQFKAIVRLQASRRWSVTGTPVQNRLEDLAALLQFLRVKPFDDRNKFNRFIVDPFKACNPEIVPKLRILVDSITLRRLKDKINLPPRSDQVVKLDFSVEERQIYNLFEKNAQDRVQVLAGSGMDKALGGHTYIHILRSILRLRLLCAHGKDLLNEEDLETLQGMTADMAIDLDSDKEDSNGGSRAALSDRRAYEMFELMQDTNADTCTRCSRKLGTSDSDSIESEGQEDILGYMTPCFHIICGGCIKGVKEQAKASPGQCPFCPNQTQFQFVEIRRTVANAEHDGHGKKNKTQTSGGKRTFDKYEGPHTKTKALIEDLLKIKALSAANPTEPPYKAVVFSTWTSHLDLIQFGLDSVGIMYTRLDGSMSRPARTAAMDKFRDDPSVQVILVSITAGGLGLNLTAGNYVYVMEPQYNPAAEAQAIDRVHRLGQKRPVQTVRYIMRDSFEEKMLDLQDKKKKLASLSMDGKDRVLERGEAARQRLMDLRSLFK